jgi:hypothetical protein
MGKYTIFIILALTLSTAFVFADSFKDLSSKDAETRIEAAHYFEEKAGEEGLTEEELGRLIELADDSNDEVSVASRDAVLKNSNLEITEIWAERYATRGNKYGSFICYVNAYYINSEKYAVTSDAEVKDILKADRDKAKTKAIEAYKAIRGSDKKELATPIYNNL